LIKLKREGERKEKNYTKKEIRDILGKKKMREKK
jgi:hypothetical protein